MEIYQKKSELASTEQRVSEIKEKMESKVKALEEKLAIERSQGGKSGEESENETSDVEGGDEDDMENDENNGNQEAQSINN